MIYLCDYFDDWICNHKEGVVRAVTLKKYRASLKWLRLHFPKQALTRLDRAGYQKIINTYAQTHESATVRDFHTHIKACWQQISRVRKRFKSPEEAKAFVLEYTHK